MGKGSGSSKIYARQEMEWSKGGKSASYHSDQKLKTVVSRPCIQKLQSTAVREPGSLEWY